ncbi:insulin-degrading enzyme [Diaphorina citri]|uniref:Insulin-degrading enzyme n=1 Tax=Diaphorina citri TaxID=121845 RepID=A0A1S4EFX8_DIACI|nr:insulin-degrading enzyme [Diaphorina citri]
MIQKQESTRKPTIRFAQLGQLLIIAVTTSVFVLGFLWCRTNLSKSSHATHRPADIPCRGQTGFWDYSETQLTRQTSQTSCASSLDQAEAGAVHTTIFNAQVLKDSQQQAIPFLRPNYERQENIEIDEEEEEVHAPQSPDMSFLHDQDTMPSTWSPEANESTSSNDTIHNFDQPGTSSGNENSNDSEPQPKRIRLNNSESDDKIDVCNPMSNQDESQTGEEHYHYPVTVDLTLDGINHADDIVELLFQYIKLIHDQGPQEWIFKEYKEILDIEFRFKEKEKPSSYVSSLCSNLHLYPLNEILVAPYMLTEYKPDLISDLLNRLRPDNMRLALVAKQFEPLCDKVEPWYGTKYTRQPMSEEQLTKWTNVSSNDAFHLPSPNEFIATDFSLLPSDPDISPHPTILYNSPLIRAWHKQDDEYRVPKLNASFEFISPYAYLDPECTNMTHLFISLFKDALNEYSYDAKLAGLAWDLSNTKYGMMLGISGYSHKQSVLLSKVLDKLADFSNHIDPKRYEIIKEQYYRGLKNFEAEQPYQHAIYSISLCLFERAWSKTELLESLDGITREKLVEFSHDLLSKMFIEALIHGNANKQVGLSIVKMLEEKLQTKLKAKPLLPSQLLRFREIKIPEKSNLVYETQNAVHKSSCIEAYYQCGVQELRDNVLLELFYPIPDDEIHVISLFQEQLGYIVVSGIRKSSGVQGLRIIVQSDKHPLFVDSRIEAFLAQMKDLISNMPDEEFQSHKEALSAQRLEKPKKLSGLSSRFWLEITTQQYNFDRANIEVAYLKSVTKENVLKFYDDLLAKDAPFRHKLAVHLISKAPGGAGTLSDEENQIVDLKHCWLTVITFVMSQM